MGTLTDAEIARIGTDPIPTEPYWSDEYFELERRNLFGRVWLHAGREVDIPEVGTSSSRKSSRATPRC